MQFLPKKVDRSKGDVVNSQQHNDQNRDLYADVEELLEKEMELYARTRILSAMMESQTAGYSRHAKAQENLPIINYKSNFVYPDTGAKATISSFYGEITCGISGSQDAILNTMGKKRPEIEVIRSSDNLIFSQIIGSFAETRIADAVEPRELPYIIRIRSIDERISVRININSPFGLLEFNTVEFVPYPFIGGTEIRGVSINHTEQGIIPLAEPQGDPIDFTGDPENYYLPIRFVTDPQIATRVSYDLQNDLFVPSVNSMIMGVRKLGLIRHTFESVSYIGFRIPETPGRALTTVKPVTKWHNSYVGNMTFKVYGSLTDLLIKNDDILASYDSQGRGTPVLADKDLYVLVTLETALNVSPQLVGFDYTLS